MATEKDYQRRLLRDEITLDYYEQLIDGDLRRNTAAIMEPKERTQSWKDFKREGLLSADWNKPCTNPILDKNLAVIERRMLRQIIGALSMLIGTALILIGSLSTDRSSPMLLTLGAALLGIPTFLDHHERPEKPKPLPVGTLPIPAVDCPLTVGGMPSVARPRRAPYETYLTENSAWMMNAKMQRELRRTAGSLPDVAQ